MMRQYTRIEDGTVREIINRPNAFDMTKAYHPDLMWVEITGVTPVPQERWLYDGVSFTAPPPPSVPPPDPDEVLKTDLEALPPSPLRDVLLTWLANRAV